MVYPQQSRFLALVGNYDEYSKALEVAANAEDAGTLQYLKTMDSIETKLQQVKQPLVLPVLKSVQSILRIQMVL